MDFEPAAWFSQVSIVKKNGEVPLSIKMKWYL